MTQRTHSNNIIHERIDCWFYLLLAPGYGAYHMHTFKIHDSIVLAPTYIVVAYCNLYLIVTREKK